MIHRRADVRRLFGAALLAGLLFAGWELLHAWLDLPGVPQDVVRSVESEDVRILAGGTQSNPGNDWEQPYVLIAAPDAADPVEAIEEALRSEGWSVESGYPTQMVLTGDFPETRSKYGVVVNRWEDYDCLAYPDICEEAKETVQKPSHPDLFVASFMPYV
ncbi:hypothetical protein [Streptomyces sp. NPDC000983]|uniref:hypothetical protein n=1 Tax=Streptomyces sp. NPDC000983 TaxID=3154373 RepID=UPI00332AF1F1